MDIVELKLPAPRVEIISVIKEFVEKTTLNPDNKRWLDEFYNNQINSVEHLFTQLPSLDILVQEQYQKYFRDPIISVIGIMKNAIPSKPACLPPHIDRGRALAINYYLNLGGTNVQTVYYDLVAPTSANVAKNYLYSEVSEIGQTVFDEGRWYAYNVNRVHSVENIKDLRYFLSIAVATNMTAYSLNDLLLEPAQQATKINV